MTIEVEEKEFSGEKVIARCDHCGKGGASVMQEENYTPDSPMWHPRCYAIVHYLGKESVLQSGMSVSQASGYLAALLDVTGLIPGRSGGTLGMPYITHHNPLVIAKARAVLDTLGIAYHLTMVGRRVGLKPDYRLTMRGGMEVMRIMHAKKVPVSVNGRDKKVTQALQDAEERKRARTERRMARWKAQKP
jgi:hypothetical protein